MERSTNIINCLGSKVRQVGQSETKTELVVLTHYAEGGPKYCTQLRRGEHGSRYLR
jgi:hypothetical protein